MDARTSVSHPIRVDWLPGPWPGKVGLTLAPGKQQPVPLTGAPWARDLAADLDRLRDEHGATVLVPLLEDHELTELRIPSLTEAAEERGLAVWRHPIRDGGLPPDRDAFRALITKVHQAAEAGETVVVHCKGGLGRAGTVGGCVLVAASLEGEEALRVVRAARGANVPETEAQRNFVRRFGAGR